MKIVNIIAALMLVGALAACDNAPVADSAIQSASGFSNVAGVTLEVGKPAPDFALTNIKGELESLVDYRGQGVFLIFYRGSWCPFCVSNLEDIQTILPEFSRLGFQVVAISPDDASGLQKMADKMAQPYLFLSDPKLETIDRYGIRKDEELPHPAVVIIDKKGIVQWYYVGEDFKERPSASQLKEVLNRLYPATAAN